MDRRFSVVLLVSAVFASCVAVAFYRIALNGARPAAKVLTRPVVVAAMDLPVGTLIKPSDLKLVQMPETSLPRNSLSKLEDVQSRAVMGKIFQDEPVLTDRLAAAGSPSGLAPMIGSGQRAVGVRVNDVISVAGFVQPGMRVDVVLTGHPPGSQNSVSRTVLQNILVLSTGPSLQAEPKGQAINAAVVTLSVDPAQAEILILASVEGKVQLVLRNSTDSRIDPSKGIQLSSLYGSGSPQPAEEPPPAPVRRANREKKPVEPSRVVAIPVEAIQVEPIPVMTVTKLPRTVEVIRGSKISLDPIDSQAVSRKSSK